MAGGGRVARHRHFVVFAKGAWMPVAGRTVKAVAKTAGARPELRRAERIISW